MAIDLQTAFNELAINDPEENLEVVKGVTNLSTWEGLPMVDLGEIAEDFEFDNPGLHKRVRACLGGLLSRSGDNVSLEWGCEVRPAPPGYSDYDRIYFAELWSSGSSWGSQRGAVVRLVWATHVTGGGTIEYHYPLYISGMGLYGIGTDSQGDPAVAFRLFIPVDEYGRGPLHSEVESLWIGLVNRAKDEILERLQLEVDHRED